MELVYIGNNHRISTDYAQNSPGHWLGHTTYMHLNQFVELFDEGIEQGGGMLFRLQSQDFLAVKSTQIAFHVTRVHLARDKH